MESGKSNRRADSNHRKHGHAGRAFRRSSGKSCGTAGPCDAALFQRFCNSTIRRNIERAGVWEPLRLTPGQTGYIKMLLTTMPKANAFNAGDGLNTASYSWERGRAGSLSGGNAAALAHPNGVNRIQLTLRVDHNLSTKH